MCSALCAHGRQQHLPSTVLGHELRHPSLPDGLELCIVCLCGVRRLLGPSSVMNRVRAMMEVPTHAGARHGWTTQVDYNAILK